jgi:hypothetical protein
MRHCLFFIIPLCVVVSLAVRSEQQLDCSPAPRLSIIGQKSLAMLLGHTEESVLPVTSVPRSVVQELISDQKRFEQLGVLFAQYQSVEQSVLTILEQAKKYEATELEYSMMLFKLPGFAALKKYPLVKTVELSWSWFVRSYWLFFLSVATIQMALYGTYALATSEGTPVIGAGLSPATYQEYNESHGDYYMSLDTRFLWQFGPRKTKFRGALALISAVFAAAGVVREAKEYVSAYYANKREWKELAQVLYGLVVMKQVYKLLKNSEKVRELADCKRFFTFFEKHNKLEESVRDLCAISVSCVFDADTGTHLLPGYSDKVKELLFLSHKEFSGSLASFGRIEAYCWCTRLM